MGKTLSIPNKDIVLKTAREKCQFTCKGKVIRVTEDFSAQTLKAKKEAIKENNFQHRLLYPSMTSIYHLKLIYHLIQQYHSWGYTQKTVTPEAPAHPCLLRHYSQ
jgi:hypothetical protein